MRASLDGASEIAYRRGLGSRLPEQGYSTSPQQRRAAYRQLCEREASIPLFSRVFWLDAVCGADRWDVALATHGERIEASLPYFERSNRLLRSIVMPPLTQAAGPWLRPSSARYGKRMAREKDLLTELILQLEAQCPFDRFQQNFHHSITNWLPFHWRGYTQTTRYTYILPDLGDLDAVWAETLPNVRTDVRKAEGRNGLVVRPSDDIDELLRLASLTFARQGQPSPYDPGIVRAIDRACRERDCSRILLAHDPQGRAHGAVYLVWDQNAAYYLISGSDPELRNSGATSLLVWEAIKLAATVTKSFDFEGSMLEPVERFVRAFGARQVPYFTIRKNRSAIVEVGSALLQTAHTIERRVRRPKGDEDG